jgi:hypothetical protein
MEDGRNTDFIEVGRHVEVMHISVVDICVLLTNSFIHDVISIGLQASVCC